MSQELIAIIGAATVALALAVTAHAQVDCADWNTAAFFEAAEVSDVTRCLQMGAAPEVRNEFGYTPLHSAAWSGAGEAVTALLEAGATSNARTESGETPLHFAAWSGTVEGVIGLLDAGAVLEARNEDGETPLHHAALSESGRTISALLAAGADLEKREERRFWTPLLFAARFGTGEAMTALLEAGASPNACDNDGKLPFDYARDNEQLKGTDAYWKLNDARFQSREIGEGVFQIGEIIDPPTIIYRRDPIYSEDARKAQYEGTVVLEAIVRKDGSVEIVRVVRGLGLGLDENAMEALSEWRFSPAMRNGQPVDVVLNIEVNFTLR